LVGPPKSAVSDTSVTRTDLAHLGAIKELLSLLNDPYAGGTPLVHVVDRIRVLQARCLRRAKQTSPDRPMKTTSQVLALIGNRGLEAELLTLLEDLTMLNAELEV
jgi:hypothetical protein